MNSTQIYNKPRQIAQLENIKDWLLVGKNVKKLQKQWNKIAKTKDHQLHKMQDFAEILNGYIANPRFVIFTVGYSISVDMNVILMTIYGGWEVVLGGWDIYKMYSDYTEFDIVEITRALDLTIDKINEFSR